MLKNEVGNRYSRLTVLSRAENNRHGDAQWLCECNCGNHKIILGRSLRSGNTKSCGCLNKEQARQLGFNNTADLLGKRFGSLLVIRRHPGNKQEIGVWECVCDCGAHAFARTEQLHYQEMQSCGCVKSKGEREIAQLLFENRVNFEREYTVDTLRSESGRLLRFDFAIFKDKNLLALIEYDGKQHFEMTGWDNSREDLQKRRQHDAQKK